MYINEHEGGGEEVMVEGNTGGEGAEDREGEGRVVPFVSEGETSLVLSEGGGGGGGGGGDDNSEECARQLFQCRLSRKKTEQDALLLANRIALLRAEEDKARKKIDETKKRSQEVMEIRRRNEAVAKQREEARLAQEKEQEAMRERHAVARQNHIRRRNERVQDFHSGKVRGVDEYYEQREKMKADTMQSRRQQLEYLTQRREMIKCEEMQSIMKRKQEEEKVRHQAKHNFQEKIKQEIALRVRTKSAHSLSAYQHKETKFQTITVLWKPRSFK
eukprot:GHVQ01003947.1.p1 GENE.GHVQ01003947.1~~GHVQ01003947.1.p1  ORF type:complete len:274 (-),score=74.10 GHVQ01003947.1:1131-1952(-)